MHEGRLTKHQLQQWVLNRYYYQTRIPIKDALIVSKSEDPGFRRMWIRRIHDHDGDETASGGLALWRRLAVAVGLEEDTLTNYQSILPGVRFACDAYVTFVREATLVESVASSLTELFAPPGSGITPGSTRALWSISARAFRALPKMLAKPWHSSLRRQQPSKRRLGVFKLSNAKLTSCGIF
jgi:hypothetical protein